MRDPFDPVEKALQKRLRQSRTSKKQLPNRARSKTRKGKPDPRPPASLLFAPDEHSPEQLRLAAVVTRISTMPHTAHLVQLSAEARLDVAAQLLDGDPDARERFGDAATLSAFLLALARRSSLHQ